MLAAVWVPLLLLVGLAAQDVPPSGLEPPREVVPGVWFQQSKNIAIYGCNIAWIDCGAFVVVVDTAFPRGAESALANIKATTGGKPIRYAVVTHYHNDHAFGSGVFAAEGATIVAHEQARHDYVASGVAAYQERAKVDPAFRKHDPYASDLTFARSLTLDAGERHIELHWLGHAHTSGDVLVWLPREKVLCTGDVCVNGAFNYVADADTASWIDVLAQAKAWQPECVVPGHGDVGDRGLLDTQQRYFVELRAQVASLLGQGKDLATIQQQVDVPMWKRWTGVERMDARHIAHVYGELTRGVTAAPLADTRGSVVAVPRDRAHLTLLTGVLEPAARAALQAVAPNVKVIEVEDGAQALAAAGEIDVMDARWASPQVLRAATRLRWVQSMSAGVERLVAMPEIRDNDALVLTNMQGMYGPPIADHAMSMVLALARGLPAYQRAQREGRWERAAADEPRELHGQTMLVLGLGGIGHEVAKRAHAFGMRVLATSRTAKAAPSYVARVALPEAMPELLALADVVVICVPLTKDTEGLLGAKQLAACKRGAVIVNIARGKVLDTEALTAALESGHLGGAGLDVTEPEPLPAEHRLWQLPNVLVTPHVSGRSAGSQARQQALWLENLRRFVQGEPLLNVVDKQAGY